MTNNFRSFTKHRKQPLHVIPHVMPLPTEVDIAVCTEFASLGDAVGFPPNALDPNAELDRVILSLALICNDIIDAFAVAGRMSDGKSVTTVPSPYEGARTGRQGWASRIVTSIIHEALETIQKHEALLNSDPEVAGTLATMTPKNCAAWGELMALALARDNDPRRQFLIRIRNNFSYHYAEPKALAAGYRRVFFEDPKTDFNRWAYVSAGETFEGLRFYFADAAVGTAASVTAEKLSDQPLGELAKVGSMAINALHNFVLKFMDMRVSKLMNETT